MKPKKELLFSLTAADFDFTYTKGSGKGGQKRNKTSSAVYCTHPPSGAQGYSEASRSQRDNKEEAFEKCVTSEKFKNWHKLEVSKRTGELAQLEAFVEQQMKQVKVEVRENDKWVDEKVVQRNNTNNVAIDENQSIIKE